MIIGSLTVDIRIPDSHSLKDKRQVVRSLLEGIRGKFNVASAEIDSLDLLQRATLGFVTVANDRTFVEQVLRKVEEVVESEPRCHIIDSDIEIF